MKINNQVKEILLDLPIFRLCSETELSRFVTLMSCDEFVRSDIIFHQSEQGDSVYLIISGIVEVIGENDIVLSELKTGQFFGIDVILKNEVRTATVRCVSESVLVYKITKKDLKTYFDTFPHLQQPFARNVEDPSTELYYQDRKRIDELLSELHIFKSLEDGERKRLSYLARIQLHSKGDCIFSQGDEGDSAYLIYTGRIKISANDGKGKQVTFATLNRGDLFGERAIIKQEKRNATAEAIGDDTVLCQIYQKDFDKLLEQYPRLMDHFNKVIEETATTNYLRVALLEFVREKTGILIASFIILILSITFFPIRYLVKKDPPQSSETRLITLPVVDAIPIKSSTKTITYKAFGTVNEDKLLTLYASVSGKILRAPALGSGQKISKQQELFSIDTTTIDLQISSLKAKLESLTIEKTLLVNEIEVLKERIKPAEKLVKIAKQALEKHNEIQDLRRENFRGIQLLFDNKSISKNEYANEKARLRKTELSVLNADKSLQTSLDSLLSLNHLLQTKIAALEMIPQRYTQMQNTISESMKNRDKAIVRSEFGGRIVEVFVNEGQEVSMGNPLAKIRSNDTIFIALNIPDTYLKWYYKGPLPRLNSGLESQSPILDIVLVSTDTPRTYSGGYIKTIGERLLSSSRSLPVVISRKNPRDKNGNIIATEELLPGMPCYVEIPLCQVPDVIIVPGIAVQNGQELYNLLPTSTANTYKLQIIKPIHIIHEVAEGYIIDLDSSVDQLLIVTHRIVNAQNGMLVTRRLTQ